MVEKATELDRIKDAITTYCGLHGIDEKPLVRTIEIIYEDAMSYAK